MTTKGVVTYLQNGSPHLYLYYATLFRIDEAKLNIKISKNIE